MSSTSVPTRRQVLLVVAAVVVTVLVCGGLLTAAALVPAPTVVLPFIVVSCVGLPTIASLELRRSLTGLRSGARRWRRGTDAKVLAEMRRYLEQLPETPHPLDG
jgi:urea transporter